MVSTYHPKKKSRALWVALTSPVEFVLGINQKANMVNANLTLLLGLPLDYVHYYIYFFVVQRKKNIY